MFRAGYLVAIIFGEVSNDSIEVLICRDFYVVSVFAEFDTENLIALVAASEGLQNLIIVIENTGRIDDIVKDFCLHFDDPRE